MNHNLPEDPFSAANPSSFTQAFAADRIEITNSHALSERQRQLLTKCDFEQNFNQILCALVISVDTYIHGIEKERFRFHREYPKDWWQAFKERWFPKWALRRWPVEMEVIDIDHAIYGPVCPHLMHEDQGVHFEWMANT